MICVLWLHSFDLAMCSSWLFPSSLGDAHKIRATWERHAYLHLGNLSKIQSESDREYVLPWIRYMQSCPPIHTGDRRCHKINCDSHSKKTFWRDTVHSISCSNHTVIGLYYTIPSIESSEPHVFPPQRSC